MGLSYYLIKCLSGAVVLALFVFATVSAEQEGQEWQILEAGLELAAFPSPQPSDIGDSLIRVLRIDPHKFELRLLNTSRSDKNRPLTAKEWCKTNGLVAAINASMYRTDYRTSVSYMRTKDHINNPNLTKDNAILAFDRQNPEVAPVKMIDRECDNFDVWAKKYGTLIQSIRMISCKGKNVWAQQQKKWSTAAIGIDKQGRVLFIHVRSPFTTHDFINILMKLPLNISRAMYVEGGPEAQLYVYHGDQEYEFVGSYETSFNENDQNNRAWAVPNVIGVARRD